MDIITGITEHWPSLCFGLANEALFVLQGEKTASEGSDACILSVHTYVDGGYWSRGTAMQGS